MSQHTPIRFCALAILLLAAGAAPAQSKTDEAGIWQALLEFERGQEEGTFLLLDAFEPPRGVGEELLPFLEQVPRTLLARFQEMNKSAAQVPDEMTSSELYWVPSREELAAFASGDNESKSQVLEKYPHLLGVATLSTPVVSPDGKSALVYAAIYFEHDGEGNLYLMEQGDSGWRVSERLTPWRASF